MRLISIFGDEGRFFIGGGFVSLGIDVGVRRGVSSSEFSIESGIRLREKTKGGKGRRGCER